MISIDIKFNMFSDTPEGEDPDAYSKTLNSYHQKLWSKKLPNGKMMHLEQGRDGKRLILKAKEPAVIQCVLLCCAAETKKS